jgi:hypothetical protein
MRYEKQPSLLAVSNSFPSRPFVQMPIVCEKPCAPKFKLSYFEKISRAAKVQNVDEVLVQCGDDIPLSMAYTFGQGISAFNFFLAPVHEEP